MISAHDIAGELAERPHKSGEILTIDDVKRQFRTEHTVALEALKLLSQKNLGRFVVGRGSSGRYKTRIEWGGSSGSEPVLVEPMATTALKVQTRATQRVCIEYRFPLDELLDISLSLPRDLTKAEAERISKFISSLAADS